MTIRIVALIAFVFFLSGCAQTQTSNVPVQLVKQELDQKQKDMWNKMVGKWYGEQPTENGGTGRWINERFGDGTYKIEFRVTMPDGTAKQSIEIGQWGVSGAVYFSIFKGWIRNGKFVPSDQSDAYNYDAYHIVNLDDHQFEYEHIATGNRFAVRRVAPDFEFE